MSNSIATNLIEGSLYEFYPDIGYKHEVRFMFRNMDSNYVFAYNETNNTQYVELRTDQVSLYIRPHKRKSADRKPCKLK